MSDAAGERIETGVEAIDRRLGGGIPGGSVVALSASPASQSELFLREFAAIGDTVYLSTVRSETAVAENGERWGVASDDGSDDPEVAVVRLDPGSPIEDARRVVDDLGTDRNLVVDPTGVLEECDAAEYRRFLADLERRATATGGVVVLHCLRTDHTPAGRTDTLHVADLVFELATEADGESVVNRLTVPKFRGGQAMEDVVKLDLADEVQVDLSRTII